jgi:protein O-mannosyl-transferase
MPSAPSVASSCYADAVHKPDSRRARRHPRAPAATPGPTARAVALGLLALATLAAFAGVLANGWIYVDDPLYVFANPHVVGGLRPGNVLWFLGHAHGETWHPLTSLSHLLDVQLFGLNPGPHHAVSLLLHVANAVLLAVVLARLTGAWWRSLAVAALFAVHPLRVESVAWISERKDVLSALLFLLTIEAYRRWARRPSPRAWALVLAGFTLGVLAKPMVVTLPLVLVLLDVWPLGRLGPPDEHPGRARRRSLAGLVAEKWPLFLIAALAATVTFLVQRASGAVASLASQTPALRLFNALAAYARYVGATLWPRHLAVIYPLPASPPVLAGTLAALGLAAVTVLALRQARARPWLIVGWLWFVVMLLPVIGIVQVGRQAWADRYSYLPTIGLLIAIVWSVAEWAARAPARRPIAAAAAVLAVLAASVATARQVRLWRDTRTLLTHAVAVTRDNAPAEQYLGDALMIAGDARGAVPHLEAALKLAPDFPTARGDLGVAYGEVGRYDEAYDQLERALRQHDSADLHYDVAYVLARQGRHEEALRQCQAALALEPDHANAHAQMALSLAELGRLDEAVPQMARAVALKPDNVRFRQALDELRRRAAAR